MEVVNYAAEDDNLGTDVHVVAGFIKGYLREMPEPLLTFDSYANFIELGSN